MTVWFVIALMTAAAVLSVLWPLWRRTAATRSGSDVVIYRDQFDEIERDRAAGMIGASEAEAARIEISRRLISAMDVAAADADTEQAPPASRFRYLAAGMALIALPLGAIVLYLALGSPSLPGQPFAERVAKAHGSDKSIATLVVQVESYLAKNPNDGRGWEVIAPVYMRLERYTDAVKAHRNVLRLLGATAEREAYLGEAIMSAANGVITAEAKAAFDRAIKIDAGNVAARYYLGLAAEQDGRPAEAIKIWRALLAEAPPGAPWIPEVQQVLARIEGTSPPSDTLSAQLPPIQQTEIIRGMVENLAARLKKDGSDADGWLRLVRSYLVLGERDKAQMAAEDARQVLGGDADKMAPIEALLQAPAKSPHPSAAASASPSMPDNAAAAPTAHENDDQIRAMVQRLSERLKKDSSDAQGWQMLVRSLLVMGDREKAKAALEDARRAIGGDAAKIGPIEDLIKNGVNVATSPSSPTTTAGPGPNAQEIAAAAKLAPDQQGEMIRGMVQRLADRLKNDGSDVDGWQRLVRSYMVLGERDNAREAAANARRALEKEPEKRRQLDEFVKGLGLES